MMSTPGANRVMTLVDGLLDRGYDRVTAATLRAIAGSTNSGIVAQRLTELDAEVTRLAEAHQRLQPDNPVLRALLADMEPVLRRDAARIDGVAQDVQASGAQAASQLTRELSIGGMSDAQLMRLGVRWNTPDPEAVARAVGYVQSEAFAGEIAKYPQLILDTVRNQAVRGIVEGWNPTRTAREIRRMTENLPAHQANTIMRTLQLTTYREANAIQQQANADILSHQIRIGTLDSRICMACLALHGTRLEVGERVDDHHNGRCTSIAVVKGVTRNIPTGEDWFNGLPEGQQLAIAGPGALELLQSGRAQLRDFVATYEDPVYGRMVRQAALREMAARQKPAARNKPVSAALRDFQGFSSDEQRKLRRVLELIDNVHDDGVLSAIPTISKPFDGRSTGTFSLVDGNDGLQAMRISLAPQKNIELTYIHEIGHFIDWEIFRTSNDRLGYGSVSAAFDTQHAMSGWLQVVKKTPEYERLFNTTVSGDDALTRYTAYLAQPQELWARSYSQYIATRSGDKQLLEIVDDLRADFDDVLWSDDSFAPIADSIDNIFRIKGWLP